MSNNARYCFKNWWSAICRKGDPLHRPNLTSDAFLAGYNSGVLAAAMMVERYQIDGREMQIGIDIRSLEAKSLQEPT